MEELIRLLENVPYWASVPLVTLTILVILNKIAEGKPGAYIASWLDRKMASQDRNYNAVHAMLRESIEEQAREWKELNEDIHRMTQSLGEGQASLAVKNSETRALISGLNLHLTKQHDMINNVEHKIDVLTGKIEGFSILLIHLERRISDDMVSEAKSTS